MPLVFLVHRYSHQAFTVFGRVPNMEIDHTLEQQLQPILFHKTSRHLVIYVYKIHDRSSCDIQIIEVDIDIVIKDPVFDYDCCLQRWKYRFEMSLFNFTTGLLTGN